MEAISVPPKEDLNEGRAEVVADVIVYPNITDAWKSS
jgi:hypothetical protein